MTTNLLLAAPLPPITISHDSLVKMFLSGKPPQTIEAYRADLADLSRFLGVDQNAIPATILANGNGYANALALSWRADMLARKLSPATVNRRTSALRSLVKLARVLGIVPWSLETAPVASESYRDTHGPGLDGMRAVMTVLEARKDSPWVRRDRAMVRLMFDMALRRNEVASLDRSDLDLTRGVLSVTGKGKREPKPITLSPTAAAALKAWLEARGNAPGPLFPHLKRGGAVGGRLTGRGIYGIIQGIGREAGVTLRPHGCRHVSITAALDLENGNIRKVAKFSRHSDTRVIEAYDDNRSDCAGEISAKVGGLI